MDLESLKPKRKDLVFDLVEEAGFDMTDWIESSNDPRGFKANPKYCYEWSFIEPGKFVILNLWFANMREERGEIVQHNNFREDAKGNAGKATWVKRATRLDKALQTAIRENLAVRVIVNDGKMRAKSDPSSNPSRVTARQLDPVPWTITEYDWQTGLSKLVRGVLQSSFVDQFELDQAEKLEPKWQDVVGSVFIRDPGVRRAVLLRANGNCELCGERGFEMHGGAIYLETHHVVPLCENGPDTVGNVVALCPNDHKKAHYAYDRSSIRQKLVEALRRN